MRKGLLSSLLFVLAVVAGSLSGDEIPESLVQAALSHYPQWLLCQIALADPAANPGVPLSEDVSHGWLEAKIGTLTPGGQPFAIVVYKRYTGVFEKRFPTEVFERVFSFDGSQWNLASISGFADPVIKHFADFNRANAGDDVVFSDIDHDGVDEILLYGHQRNVNNRTGYTPEAIIVLALRGGVLVPITGVTSRIPRSLPGKPECGGQQEFVLPTDDFRSGTGVGFVDLDGDDIPDLLVYPKLGGRRPEGDPRENVYDVPTTGTRVYKLVNGVYAFQYETPVGVSGMPPIGGALKPASVPSSELEAVGKSGGGGKDEAISIYFMPPAKLNLADVDWASLRVGDFKIAPTADGGDSPAPHSSSEQTTWTPLAYAGQSLLLEQLSDKQQGSFNQSTKDPVVYMGVNGRLHFTTPFHEVRFSKKALFGWLLAQWQQGGGNQQLKQCVPQGNHQRCFTPLSLPVKVNLKGSNGYAMGEAVLWVETKE